MESESNIHDERWCIICPEWEKFPQKLVIIDGWNIWKAQEILLEVTSNIRPKTHSCFHFISISRKAWIKCLEDFFTIVSRVRGDKNKLRFDFSRDYYCLNVMSSFRSWIVALCSMKRSLSPLHRMGDLRMFDVRSLLQDNLKLTIKMIKVQIVSLMLSLNNKCY